uniref:Uncharacterized protein DKFZp469P2021 n=1 Tax=Pongo abelii TaxID=9601 RepID=Q5RF91_PONAB|nr:hypothetical protein [Pongo abelii]
MADGPRCKRRKQDVQ